NQQLLSKSMSYYFVIVNPKDEAIYELEHSASRTGDRRDDHRHLNQLVANSALDIVDESLWSSSSMYLKTVDKFNDLFVSAFVTPSRLRLLILHDTKNEDGIRHFFSEMFETYVKLALNPFYQPQSPIKSAAFDRKAQQFARKFLN
ncbi:hypothetical protein BOX15_Mlig002882g1, partial [Macrostomum lignano]